MRKRPLKLPPKPFNTWVGAKVYSSPLYNSAPSCFAYGAHSEILIMISDQREEILLNVPEGNISLAAGEYHSAAGGISLAQRANITAHRRCAMGSLKGNFSQEVPLQKIPDGRRTRRRAALIHREINKKFLPTKNCSKFLKGVWGELLSRSSPPKIIFT